MRIQDIAPRFGVTGEKLTKIGEAVAIDTAALSETLNVSRAGVIVAMLGVFAALCAKIDRAAAVEYLRALALSIQSGGSELDRRRVDKCAIEIFAADQRVAVAAEPMGAA